jgi:hypothetical protein
MRGACGVETRGKRWRNGLAPAGLSVTGRVPRPSRLFSSFFCCPDQLKLSLAHALTKKIQYLDAITRAWGDWALFQQLLAVLRKIGDRHGGVTIANVAVRWVLDHPFVGAVLVGALTSTCSPSPPPLSSLLAFFLLFSSLSEPASPLYPPLFRSFNYPEEALLEKWCAKYKLGLADFTKKRHASGCFGTS